VSHFNPVCRRVSALLVRPLLHRERLTGPDFFCILCGLGLNGPLRVELVFEGSETGEDGEIGRRARFRIWWATVRVQVPFLAPLEVNQFWESKFCNALNDLFQTQISSEEFSHGPIARTQR
jgi:hypothetical protein